MEPVRLLCWERINSGQMMMVVRAARIYFNNIYGRYAR